MKKRYILISLMVAFFIFCGIFIKCNYTQLMTSILGEQPVQVQDWNMLSREPDYTIAKIEYGMSTGWDGHYCYRRFHTGKSLNQLVRENADYLGEMEYFSSLGHSDEVKLFYYNNSHYMIYPVDDEGGYKAECCYSQVDVGGHALWFPSPLSMSINQELICKDTDNHPKEFLYHYFSFEEATDFYQPYSKDVVQIDAEKSRIIIDACDWRQRLYLDACIVLDFKEQSITVRGEDTVIHISGGGEIIEK